MSDALHPVIRGGVAHFPENETDAEAELFTICMPAAFDRFQLEVGERESRRQRYLFQKTGRP
jgi:hypothetical protein